MESSTYCTVKKILEIDQNIGEKNEKNELKNRKTKQDNVLESVNKLAMIVHTFIHMKIN